MRAALGISCLGFLLYCNFAEGNVLDNMKKVSSGGTFESDSSDVIRALQRKRRHATEEVERSRQKRDSPPLVDHHRTVRYAITNGLGSDGWNKLVKSDFVPVVLTIVREGFIGGMHDDVEFAIDRSVVRYIYMEVKGDCENLIVTSPNGSNTRVPFGRHYGRTNAEVERADSLGIWTITANTTINNTCSVKVTAPCAIGFTMSLMTKHSYENDSAYRAIEGNPNKNKSLGVILDGFGMEALKSGGKDMVDTVRFVNQSGYDVIDPVHVTDDVNGLNSKVKVYLNDGLKTSQPVYVIIEGKDYQGHRFTRAIPEPIRPSHVTLKCEPRDVIMQTEVETTFDVIVHNHERNDTFIVDSSDSASFTSSKIEAFQINSKETRGFPVSARTSFHTAEGTTSSLKFAVRGSLPGSSQQTSCNIVVGKPSNPRIDSLTIDGTINSRFAETVVMSVMTNYADVGLEAKFDILLPVDSFITNLTMTLDDVTIVGRVDEKERAKKIYEKAKKRGKTTAHVAAQESSTRVFKTSLFVGPGKKVIFRLTYQQLLGRSRGSYKYTVALNPNQLVKKLKVSVHIEEQEEIDYISIPYFDKITSDTSRHPAGTTVIFGNTKRSAHIKYNPLPAQQIAFRSSNAFSILYDVVRTKVYGDVTVANGYFAHFYTPLYLAPPPKKVMFIIDKSGSMGTTKMHQVKEAMRTILKSLDEVDFFGIIFFDNGPNKKGAKLRKATAQNVKQSLTDLSSVDSGGGTRIIPAFKTGFEEFNLHFNKLATPDIGDVTADHGSEELDMSGDDLDMSGDDLEISGDLEVEDKKRKVIEDDYENLIVFLTDGQGESPSEVLKQIKRNNIHKIAIHTIAFGQGAARDLLQSIAAQHDGTYRMVFDGLTASAQIDDFFQEITAPSLRNISIEYPVNRIVDVTQSKFQAIQSKSEIVWAGRIKEEEELLDVGLDEPLLEDFDVSSGGGVFINAHLSGHYLDEDLEIDIPINSKKAKSRIMTSQHQIANFTERLWAFLQIKELLKELVLAKGNPNASALIKEKALNMSLQYNFVTPLTSMVVVLPDDLKDIEEELKSEEKERRERIKEDKMRRREEEKQRLEAERLKMEQERLRMEKERQRLEEERKLLKGPSADQSSQIANLRTSHKLSRGRGGGYGDPHFIIPLRPDINLCFNWDGEEGEVYNLFYDPSAGVAVNGKLIRTEAPEETGKSHRTYISVMGLILPEYNLKIVVRPETVTLISKGIRNITLPVLSSMMITRHGVKLRMYDVKFKTAKIELSGEDWSFDIIVTRNIRNHHQACHVDFFVNSYKNHLMSPLSGVIGQFLNSDVSVAHDNKLHQTIMTINNRSGRVTTIEREQPWSREKVTCWSSHSNARDIIQGSHEHYLVEDVLKNPSYYWI